MENKYYAGFFIRALAFIIDINLLSAIIWPGLLIFNLISMAIFKTENSLPVLLGSIIFTLFVFFDYFIFTTYFFGATIGKRLLELEVRNKDTTRTDPLHVIVRETVGRILSGLLFLGYIWIFINSQKRGFHDLLAGTVVLRSSLMKKSDTVLLACVVIAIVGIIPLIIVFLSWSLLFLGRLF